MAITKYTCIVCGYVYDPEHGDPDQGIAPGTSFDDLPEDCECPVCGSPVMDFEEIVRKNAPVVVKDKPKVTKTKKATKKKVDIPKKNEE